MCVLLRCTFHQQHKKLRRTSQWGAKRKNPAKSQSFLFDPPKGYIFWSPWNARRRPERAKDDLRHGYSPIFLHPNFKAPFQCFKKTFISFIATSKSLMHYENYFRNPAQQKKWKLDKKSTMQNKYASEASLKKKSWLFSWLKTWLGLQRTCLTCSVCYFPPFSLKKTEKKVGREQEKRWSWERGGKVPASSFLPNSRISHHASSHLPTLQPFLCQTITESDACFAKVNLACQENEGHVSLKCLSTSPQFH